MAAVNIVLMVAYEISKFFKGPMYIMSEETELTPLYRGLVHGRLNLLKNYEHKGVLT